MQETPERKIQFEATNCPLCGSSEYKGIMVTKDFFCHLPGEFTFTECGQCQHVFLNPRPNEETIVNCYPDHYAPHTPVIDVSHESVKVRPWYAKAPIRWIPGVKACYRWLMQDFSQILPKPTVPGERALEVGAGRGDFLTQLKAVGWSVQGIEPSQQAAEQAQANGHTVEVGVLEDACFPEAHFQVIFAWMVLEHLISPLDALAAIYRWLSPGGSFYFSVPNYGCLEPKLFGKHWFAWEAPRHLHQFSVTKIREILSSTGFEHIEVIHQRNIRDYYGSIALRLLSRNSDSRLGKKLMRWFVENPPLLVHVALSPFGIFLSLIRQGGRITVRAQKPLQ